MAIAAACVWDVRSGGSDTNGGGYVSGGVDYSQQNAAQLALTDVVANGTTTLTSATAGFTSNMVGNIIYLQGGTGSLAATRRQITGFTNSSTITVDANVASGTGITGNVGGALASPGEAGRNMVAGNDVYVKSGATFTISSTTANVSGGRLNYPAGSNTDPSNLYGYQTTHGDFAAQPIIEAGAISSTDLITLNGNNIVRGIEMDGNAQTSIRGMVNASGADSIIVRDCKLYAFTNRAIHFLGNGDGCVAINCEVSGCTSVSAIRLESGSMAFGCVSHDNSVNGFELRAGFAIYCQSYSNTGDGFNTSNGQGTVVHCNAYDNSGDGFEWAALGVQAGVAINCLAVGNNAYGFNATSPAVQIMTCAGYDNTTANVNAGATQIDFVALSGDPFTDAASDDFTLNNTAGAGAELFGVGSPLTYPGTITDNLSNIGAVQESSGGGGGNPATRAYAFIG
jgi:hypothetical protein